MRKNFKWQNQNMQNNTGNRKTHFNIIYAAIESDKISHAVRLVGMCVCVCVMRVSILMFKFTICICVVVASNGKLWPILIAKI